MGAGGADVVHVALRFGLEGGELGYRRLREVEAMGVCCCQVLYLSVEALESGKLYAEECVCRLNLGGAGS